MAAETAAVQHRQPASRLEVEGLSMMRDDRSLFEDLSFSVGAGQILQIEGRNGSGKTTLIRILCGLILPDAGTVRFNGQDIGHSRLDYQASLSYLGHHYGLKEELTVMENLRFLLALSGVHPAPARIAEVLEQVRLAGYEWTPARAMSAGQRRRLGFASLLLRDTPLWLLDEPYTALD